MTKTQKLIELMDYVKRKKSFTVQELADEFSVSYRTMWRYLQELSTLGVPLYADQGGKGGYRVLDHHEVSSQDCKKITLENSTFIGFQFDAPYSARRETEILAPKLWIKLLHQLEESSYKKPFQKFALAQFRKHDFSYYITVKVDDILDTPKGMTSLCIPKLTYVKKTHNQTLELEDTIHTYETIYKWMKEHNLKQHEHAFHLEQYDERFNPRKPVAEFDIFVPIMN
ncbi:GyrI-like domain-containing protein [Bacillus suaedaesalsae]|uniref:GyrI-like domain-containing protein n=1 Tax=Bacillus suaedaesalsae TaxID=2810349 RepID=A0ABS2DHS5_9BACI|nr:GyrI-like domain-containing protein [Bacillus suaedaesalsae]MBM6618039.1 GyrI-like domain-containing protein [Bacillus suaedaesalsae]